MKAKLLCLALVVGWLYCSGQKKGIDRVRGIVDSWKVAVYRDTTETDYKDVMAGKSGHKCIVLHLEASDFNWFDC